MAAFLIAFGVSSMWANTVWGLFGSAFACFLAKLTVTDSHILWWLNIGISGFSGLGFFVLCFPAAKRFITTRLMPSPLHIHFDPTNTAKKFWSLETRFDPSGNGPPMIFTEYRVEIKNNSSKTLRNARVTSELIGPLPHRPVPMKFDLTKTETCDINPGDSALIAILNWVTPTVQAGMLAGDFAESYGPVQVTASADDVRAVKRIFRFNYQKVPMIYD